MSWFSFLSRRVGRFQDEVLSFENARLAQIEKRRALARERESLIGAVGEGAMPEEFLNDQKGDKEDGEK